MKALTKKGFTLAELLIVMAIVVVLASIAVPTFGKQLETSRETNDLELIRLAYGEALTVAQLDAGDGKLDGQNGTIAICGSGKPYASVTFTAGTSDAAGVQGTYKVTFSDMISGSTIKQSQAGWQYLDAKIANVAVPNVKATQATSDGTTWISFSFTIADGDVKFIASDPMSVDKPD